MSRYKMNDIKVPRLKKEIPKDDENDKLSTEPESFEDKTIAV
jgi:hypothetical protein